MATCSEIASSWPLSSMCSSSWHWNGIPGCWNDKWHWGVHEEQSQGERNVSNPLWSPRRKELPTAPFGWAWPETNLGLRNSHSTTQDCRQGSYSSHQTKWIKLEIFKSGHSLCWGLIIRRHTDHCQVWPSNSESWILSFH